MVRKWTIEELKILRTFYPKNHLSNILELLKKQDMKVDTTSREIGRSKTAIYNKASEINLKKRNSLELLPSMCIPSESLAWLIGYLLGDGYLTTGWVIGMRTKDDDLKDFYIKKFREWSRCGKDKFIVNREEKKYRDEKKGKIYTCKKIWVIRVCSKKAWQFLRNFKRNPLYSLKFFPKKYWKFILKGLWDAEGNITPRKGNNRIVIGFSNSNEEILKLYETICSSLGFYPKLVEGNSEKAISIYSLAEILKFVDEIGITIARKRKKVMDRINELRKKKEVYRIVIRLRKKGLKRKQILEKFHRFLSPGTFDGWIYSGKKPYYIENAKS